MCVCVCVCVCVSCCVHEMGEEGESAQERWQHFLFQTYQGEEQLSRIRGLMEKDLSEPYSVFTYRYFLNQWPHLCWLGPLCARSIR